MGHGANKRGGERTVNHEPEFGLLVPSARPGQAAVEDDSLWGAVYNVSRGGMMAELNQALAADTLLNLSLYDFAGRRWTPHLARVAWVKPANERDVFFTGVQFLPATGNGAPEGDFASIVSGSRVKDFEFLVHTRLFHQIPRKAAWSLLNCLERIQLAGGTCFIRQGDIGDALYIVQHGTCVVRVENDGVARPVDRVNAGEIVGEMALLTGELRVASVEAESDVVLWCLDKARFDALGAKYPDLRGMLTELVTSRLESARFTADRCIGRYLIRARLGKGAFSIVYEGIHQTLKMPVAVKMLKHQLAMDPDFHQQFMGEAKIIALLSHPNIVQVYDIEERFQTLFIVMDFLEGESLEGILKRSGRLFPAQAVGYLMQICAGLSYAHKKGIIHQDIKPDNIHIDLDGRVRIVDFGLACHSGSKGLIPEGTLFYMAPEQIESASIDSRTDMYALGITAFEMLTGSRPFPEDDLVALEDMHVEQEVPSLGRLVPDLPGPLVDFVQKLCRRNPEERFRDMTEALAELEPLYNRLCRSESEAKVEERSMTTLFCFFNDEQRGEMHRLLDEFSVRAKDVGISLKIAEFDQV